MNDNDAGTESSVSSPISASASSVAPSPTTTMTITTTTTNMAEAREEIRPILSSCWSSERKKRRALELLHQYPQLAREWYYESEEHCIKQQTYSALSYFINNTSTNCNTKAKANTCLSTIQQIYALYPPALRMPNGRGRYPLHEACGANCSHEVIQFLVQEYPQAVATPDDCRQYPFHLALRGAGAGAGARVEAQQKDSKATLQLLLQQFPEAFSMPDFGGRKPLERAILLRYPREVLELLFHQHIQVETEFDLNMMALGGMRCPLDDIVEAMAAVSFLTRLNKFTFRSTRNNMNKRQQQAIIKLLELLHHSQSIAQLTLHLDCKPFPSMRQTLAMLLYNSNSNSNSNATLQTLTIEGRQILDEDVLTLNIILNSLRSKTTTVNPLASLTLMHFSLDNDNDLKELFALSKNAPKAIYLDDIQIQLENFQLEDVTQEVQHQLAITTTIDRTTATVADDDDDTTATATLKNWNTNEVTFSSHILSSILWYRQFLPTATRMLPNLKRIAIQYCKAEVEDVDQVVLWQTPFVADMTDALLSIIQQQKQYTPLLQTLVLEGNEDTVVDLKRITQAVIRQSNSTIKEFCIRTTDTVVTRECQTMLLNMLQKQSNATLQRIQTIDDEDEDDDDDEEENKKEETGDLLDNQAKLAYYANLIRFGRATVRDPKTTPSGLVKLLVQCQDQLLTTTKHTKNVKEHDAPSSTTTRQLLDCTNTLYGLLREVPGHWCSSNSSTRRMLESCRDPHRRGSSLRVLARTTTAIAATKTSTSNPEMGILKRKYDKELPYSSDNKRTTTGIKRARVPTTTARAGSS